MSDLEAIVRVLQRHSLRVVVIGGHAVNFHGYIRATEDVDVIMVPVADYRTHLAAALQEIKAFYITDEIDPATGIERTLPVTESTLLDRSLHMVGTDYGYLDIFLFVPGLPKLSAEQIWNESIQTSKGIRFVRLDRLRQLKSAAGRPIDIIDLANLPTSN